MSARHHSIINPFYMMKKLLVLISVVCSLPLAAQDYTLWYDKPAAHWLEALPVGNSQMGAMIYGGTDTEEIQLNEETFWSGSPHDNDSPAAKAHLQEVRDSIFAGKEEAAHKIIDQYFFKGPHGEVRAYRFCLACRPCRHRTTDSLEEGCLVV